MEKVAFGKMVFSFLAGKLMSRNSKCFFGCHFETKRPIFEYFAARLGFFRVSYFNSDTNFNTKFVR